MLIYSLKGSADVVSVDGGMYQYQSETKRQRTAYTRYQALELEKVAP